MIRVTVPRPVAEALMDGSLRLLVVDSYWPPGFVTDEDHPPAPRYDVARAIEAGERIEIDVLEEYDCPATQHMFSGLFGRRQHCPFCTDGKKKRRVPVGSVRPVRVLPIRTVLAPYDGEELTIAYGRQVWHGVTNITADLSVYGPAESLIGKFAVEVEDARREQ